MRRGDGVKDETIRRELAVLSAAYRYTRKYKELRYVPEVVTLPASDPKERWLSRPEAARIVRHLRKEKRAAHILLFFRIALYTGARSGAILDLTWDRVDFERFTINFQTGKRTRKQRVIAQPHASLFRSLRKAKELSRSPYVIEWRGGRVARIIRAFRGHMDALGFVDVTPHTLRHTFATWAAMKGVPLQHIGGALGQSVVTTTARYAKHHPDSQRAVFKAVRRK
jgi:integrase